MRKRYTIPTMLVTPVYYSQMLCTSVISPGEPNRPAGSRDFDEWNDD